MVRLLFGAGADPPAENRIGWSPLALAARGGHEGVVAMLLDRGAGPNVTNPWSPMSLIVAAEWANEGTVRLLLEKGADPNMKVADGWGVFGTRSRAGVRGCLEAAP